MFPLPLLKILPPLALSELFARPLCIFRKGTPPHPLHCSPFFLHIVRIFQKGFRKKTFSILFGSCCTLGYIEWGFLILNVGSLNLVKENYHPFSDILCYYNCNPLVEALLSISMVATPFIPGVKLAFSDACIKFETHVSRLYSFYV